MGCWAKIPRVGGVEGRTWDDADWCYSRLRCLVNSEGEELKGNVVACEMLTYASSPSLLLSPQPAPLPALNLAEVTGLYLEKNKLLSLSCNSLCQELKNCGMSEWVVACLLHLCLISSFDILSCNVFNSGEGHMRVDYFAFSWRSWCHKLFTNCWSFRLQVKASRGARDVTFIEMPKLWNFSQALVEGGGEKWGKKPPEVTGTT